MSATPTAPIPAVTPASPAKTPAAYPAWVNAIPTELAAMAAAGAKVQAVRSFPQVIDDAKSTGVKPVTKPQGTLTITITVTGVTA